MQGNYSVISVRAVQLAAHGVIWQLGSSHATIPSPTPAPNHLAAAATQGSPTSYHFQCMPLLQGQGRVAQLAVLGELVSWSAHSAQCRRGIRVAANVRCSGSGACPPACKHSAAGGEEGRERSYQQTWHAPWEAVASTGAAPMVGSPCWCRLRGKHIENGQLWLKVSDAKKTCKWHLKIGKLRPRLSYLSAEPRTTNKKQALPAFSTSMCTQTQQLDVRGLDRSWAYTLLSHNRC